MMPSSFPKQAVFLSFLIVGALLSPALAQPRQTGITGDWQVTVHSGNRQMDAVLSLSTDRDGKPVGQWISLRGLAELREVKCEGNAISFVRVDRGREAESTSTFRGRIEDGVLSGTLSGERGELKVEGKRLQAMPGAVGDWAVKVKTDDGELAATLVLRTDKEGKLTGKWESRQGEDQISDVAFQEPKLTFTRTSKIGDRPRESRFEGTIKGNFLSGAFKTARGDAPAEGSRIGSPVIGKWDLEIASGQEVRKQVLTVNPDLSGMYGPVTFEKVDLNGDQVSFKINRRVGDQALEISFNGKLADGKLAGQISGPWGIRKTTARKRSTTNPAEDVVQITKTPREPDVIFLPTPPRVVDKMLELAEVKKDDLLYDLGCGDGRIVVAAAKEYGCRCVGFDIAEERVRESLANVEMNGVADLVRIEQKDIFTLDLSEATVVTLYLLPRLNVRLIPQLEKLKPGSRIVSHDFDMKGVKPDKVVTVQGEREDYHDHTVYLWVTPLKKEKANGDDLSTRPGE